MDVVPSGCTVKTKRTLPESESPVRDGSSHQRPMNTSPESVPRTAPRSWS
jgi:hypothetical protein